MPVNQLIAAFNAGELSPYLDARSDIDKYRAGCQTLENFIVTTYGAAYRRPGTEYLGDVYDHDTRSRLIPFIFSETTRFVIEFSEGIARFWNCTTGELFQETSATAWTADDGGGPPAPSSYGKGQYVTNGGFTYLCLISHTTAGVFAVDLAAGKWVLRTYSQVFTPYLEDELRAVQWIQINDVIYFVHPNHPPQKLTRNGAPPLLPPASYFFTNWSFGETEWDWPALLDENLTSVTVAASATTGDGITLTDSISLGSGIFQPEHVGAYFQIAHLRASSSISKTFAANGSTSGVKVFGVWSLNTYGTWAGTVTVERSYDGGSSWHEIRSYVSTSDRNVTDGGNEIRECELRITFANRTVGTSADYALLSLADPKAYGLVKITGYTDSHEVTADVVNDLHSTAATALWSEGAWSDYRGFPRAITAHEGRIIYGGTASRPQTVWGTAIDDYQNFRITSAADSGLSITIAARTSNLIQWLSSKDGVLQVGKLDAEGNLSSGSADAAISPDSIQWSDTTRYGSAFVAPAEINDGLLFLSKDRRKLREMAYDDTRRSYIGTDVTFLSEHVSEGGILEMAVQTAQESILWAVRNDGQLLGMSYDREQSVQAWHRHVTDGEFESVCVVPGESEDEVWFAVKRTIDGEVKRFIERFRPSWRDAFDAVDKLSWWYLDCAKRIENDPASDVLEGLDHLEGEAVTVLADGAVEGAMPTVAAGEVTISRECDVAIVGLPYTSTLRPMKFEIALRNGTSQGHKAKITSVKLNVLKSLGGQYSTDGEEWDNIPVRDITDEMDASPPALTGETDDLIDRGNHRDAAEVWIRSSEPYPLTILAMITLWQPAPK